MDTATFFESVLSGDGYYCIFGANKESGRRVQKFYPTIAAALSTADNLAQGGYDAYFALATYETGESRKVDNAKELKAFFLDIDCGEGKDYPDQASGISALQKFCKALKLPKPQLVNSGRGVHVYWPLVTPVSVATWVPVAEQLKGACKRFGMNADPAVTSDAARILRVPGTFNFKTDPPADVVILGEAASPVEFDDFAALVAAGAPPVPKQFTPRPMDDVTSALAGNYTNSFKLIMQKTVAGRGCAQLAHVVTQQGDINEPMWRAGLSITKFCVDGPKAAHRISHKHPDYSEGATEAKLALIKGPYTCAKFDEYRPGVCPDCPNRGKVRSPISLGRVVQEATEEDNIVQEPVAGVVEAPQTYIIPTYPEPFFRGKAGGVFKRAKDKEGDPIDIPIYHNDIYVVRRLRDPDLGEAAVLRLHLPMDGVREFTIPLASILGKEEFRKHMAANGVAVIKMEDLMAYVTSWVNKLQATSVADEARRQFGWVDENCDAFVVGNKEIGASHIDLNPPSTGTAKLFPLFASKGTLQGWKKMVEFYNRPKMEMHQFVIGMGFGSPLMQFMPQCGAVFHVYSNDPGLGKTTAMQVGASIWGDPSLMMTREQDTTATKMNRAEVFKNIFLPVDEMTNVNPKEASDFLYQITGGMQRNRQSASSNAERTRGDSWHMLVCTTANSSLLGRVRMYKAIPKAEASRVLEYEAQVYHFADKTETDQLGRDLANNYGHACVPYIQYIINNRDTVRDLLYETQARIDRAAGLLQPHRFWSAMAASTITGIIIAKKLGLVNFKVADIVKWLIGVILKAKGDIDTMTGTPDDLLTSYLAENYTNILRIRSTDDSRIVDEQLDHLVIPDATPRMALVARYEYDVKKLYLLPKPLRDWCSKQQINYMSLLDGLRHPPTNLISKKVRMGKGTNMNLPPADALVLNFDGFAKDNEAAGAGRETDQP